MWMTLKCHIEKLNVLVGKRPIRIINSAQHMNIHFLLRRVSGGNFLGLLSISIFTLLWMPRLTQFTPSIQVPQLPKWAEPSHLVNLSMYIPFTFFNPFLSLDMSSFIWVLGWKGGIPPHPDTIKHMWVCVKWVRRKIQKVYHDTLLK